MSENPYQAPLGMSAVQIPPSGGKFLSMTLTDWLIVAVLSFALFLLLLPALQAALGASRRNYCSNSVKQPIDPERAPPVHSQQKHKLDRLAESWGITEDAIAPILAAGFCMSFVAAVVLRACWQTCGAWLNGAGTLPLCRRFVRRGGQA